MPLVTRRANQGNFFKQDTEPPDWLDGDLWSDTTANKLKLNVGDTAVLTDTSIAKIIRFK